jgi:putative tryptophan/tyrosine transport system substrate-binding protein
MNRKTVALAALAALAAVLVCGLAGAQQPSRVSRVGVMINGGPGPAFEGIRKDFAQLGYVEGKNVAFEPRFAEGQLKRHPEFAADLVRLDVDIILAVGGVAARAAKDATPKIPIVFSIITDPMALGLATTMERPGGNATGITSLDSQQANKQFELLKEVFPKLTRVAILSDQTIPGVDATGLAPVERVNDAAARALGLRPQIIKLGSPNPDFEGAFEAIAKEDAEALLVLEVPVPFAHRKRIAELATARRLPSMFPGGHADAGGVITYGTSVADTWPRMPIIADKILKGAKPGDLPVEVISRRELIVNLMTARQIGVMVPPDVVKRATRVIE